MDSEAGRDCSQKKLMTFGHGDRTVCFRQVVRGVWKKGLVMGRDLAPSLGGR